MNGSGAWRSYFKRRWFRGAVMGLLLANVFKAPLFRALGLDDCTQQSQEERLMEMHDAVVRLNAAQTDLYATVLRELVELNRRVEALAK